MVEAYRTLTGEGSYDLTEAARLAFEGLRSAIELNDDVMTAWFESSLAICYSMMGEHEKALPLLNNALPRLDEYGLRHAGAHFARAKSEAAIGDPSLVEELLWDTYRRSIEEYHWPTFIDVSLELCRLEASSKSWREKYVRAHRVAVESAERLFLTHARKQLNGLTPQPESTFRRILKELAHEPIRVFADHLDVLKGPSASDPSDLDSVRKLDQMLSGVRRLEPIAPILRLEIFLVLSSLLIDLAQRQGEFEIAAKVGDEATELALPSLERLTGDGLLYSLIIAAQQSSLERWRGNPDRADTLKSLVASNMESIKDPQARLGLCLEMCRTCAGSEHQRYLDEASQLATQLPRNPRRLDVLLEIAKSTHDPNQRLEVLLQAEEGIDDALQFYREAYDGTLPQIGTEHAETVSQAMIVEALSKTDLETARLRLDELVKRRRDTDPAIAPLFLRAASRLGDHRLQLRYASSSSRWLESILRSGAAGSDLTWTFLELADVWRDCIATFVSSQDGKSLLNLLEASQQGMLERYKHRGRAGAMGLPQLSNSVVDPWIDGSINPDFASVDSVLATMAGTTGLAFVCVEHVEGIMARCVRLVIDPSGDVASTEFVISGNSLAYLEDHRSSWRSIATQDIPASWSELSTDLLGDLPHGQRDNRIVIVPGSELFTSVPWSALLLDGSPMIDQYTIQVAPSFSAIAPTASAATSGRALVLFPDFTDLQLASEQEAWRTQSRWSVETRKSVPDVVASLKRPGAWEVGYFATHGGGTGRSTVLVDDAGATLGYETALTLWWPETVVLASCSVGHLDQQLGREPLSMPFACLIRGAKTVVGAVAPVTDRGAAKIGSRLARELSTGTPAVLALARAQRSLISELPGGTFGDWAPFQAISTAASGSRASDRPEG